MRARLLLGSGLLLWLAQSAFAATERYSVVIMEKVSGHLIAEVHGQRVQIDFDYKNNGRGPSMLEKLVLDQAGLPKKWTIRGASTFGNKVDERFERGAGRARWVDTVGKGQAKLSEPSIYVGQNASPWALGVYARALLEDPDHSLPALPGGQLTLAEGEALSIEGPDGTLSVRVYALSGLDLHPSYVLLDEQLALFAYIDGRAVVIRESFEAQATRMTELAADLSARRLQGLRALTAHDFDVPVRIHNVRIFEPQQLRLSDPLSVVVHGPRISAVVPLDSPASPGEVLIDGEGGTLVAGLYEMHGHLQQDSALLNIAAGVTSVRDMGNDNALLAKLIERIDNDTISGPRIIRSGFIEGKSPFSSRNGILVDSQSAAIDAVRWYAARGFWQVKLYNSMNPDWAPAIAAEAQQLGLRVAGHVPAFSNADAMIDAGFDELTHINQIMLGWVLQPEEDTRSLLRLTALRRLPDLDLQSARVQHSLNKIVENQIAVEPTIAIHEELLLKRNGQTPAGAVDYLEHMPVGYQRDAKQALADMSGPGDRQAYAGAYQQILATLRMMRERGVLLIPGTDRGGSFSFHREMELFQSIGYTPAEVLKLASYEMARYLGQDQQLGSIEKSKLADFFLIAGDPTQDLKAIKQIRMVVKNGTFYFPAEIYPHFGIAPFATAPAVLLPEA